MTLKKQYVREKIAVGDTVFSVRNPARRYLVVSVYNRWRWIESKGIWKWDIRVQLLRLRSKVWQSWIKLLTKVYGEDIEGLQIENPEKN